MSDYTISIGLGVHARSIKACLDISATLLFWRLSRHGLDENGEVVRDFAIGGAAPDVVLRGYIVCF